MTTDEILSKRGKFTWSFNKWFHIEVSPQENYEWADPAYGGDNTIRQCGPYHKWLKDNNLQFGRDKGTHIIGQYCGNEAMYVD